MKRMVNENLIAILKEMDSEGISIGDLAEVLENVEIGEDDNLKIKTNIDLDDNEIQDVNQIQFHDNSIMTTAPKLYALTFNISDMYYTVFTKQSCGMTNIDINGDSDDRTIITLTNEEKTALYNAFKTALSNGNNYLIGNITGDTVGYVNYSTLNKLVFNNLNNDDYSIEITFINDTINITRNPHDEEITLYESQLF